MGSYLSTTSNFVEELHIPMDDILYSEYLSYNLLNDKKCYMMDAFTTKMLLHKLDTSKYIYAHMYNKKYRLVLTLPNNEMIELAITDCGRYIGKPCNATKLNKWYYIVNNDGERTNPFTYLIQ